jgi:hypothetical protein
MGNERAENELIPSASATGIPFFFCHSYIHSGGGK